MHRESVRPQGFLGPLCRFSLSFVMSEDTFEGEKRINRLPGEQSPFNAVAIIQRSCSITTVVDRRSAPAPAADIETARDRFTVSRGSTLGVYKTNDICGRICRGASSIWSALTISMTRHAFATFRGIQTAAGSKSAKARIGYRSVLGLQSK